MRLVHNLRLSIIFLWLFLVCGPAPGRAVDVLKMKNGDRLTGEVKRVAGEKVFLKTDYAGTIQIDWLKLEGFSSDRRFEVEVERGGKYRGKLVLAEGKLTVATAKATVSVEKDRVVGLAPKAEKERVSLWRQVEGTLDLGYNLTRGHSRLHQSSLLAKAEFDRGHYKVSGDLSSILSQQDDTDPTSRQTARFRLDRLNNPRHFHFALGAFERNDRQRLNYRTLLGGGLGWTLIRNNKAELSLIGGLTFTGERFRRDEGVAAPPGARSGEGLAGIEWKVDLFDWIEFTSKLTTHPNLRDAEDYRLEYDGAMRVPLSKHLSWSLSFYDRYAHRPLVRVQRNDFGLVSAFGFHF